MLGKNPLWVARQHGHSVRTMLDVYAAWADGAVESGLVAIRRSFGFLGDGITSGRPGLLRRLAQWLIRDAGTRSEAGSDFSIWHWIWNQERGACT